MKLAPYLKAIYAMAVAGLGSIEIASIDGHFTARELIHAAIVTITSLGVVYAVPNLGQPVSAEPEGDVPINR